jgi:hypothetical protein
MAIICECYPDVQVSKENFVDIKQAIGGFVDELPEERYTPRLIHTYWAKGAANVVCQDTDMCNWLDSKVQT